MKSKQIKSHMLELSSSYKNIISLQNKISSRSSIEGYNIHIWLLIREFVHLKHISLELLPILYQNLFV